MVDFIERFTKVKKQTSVYTPLSSPFETCVTNSSSCFSQLRFFLKPCWFLNSMWFVLAKFTRWLVMMCPVMLLTTDVTYWPIVFCKILLPFLKAGHTTAVFKSRGTAPLSREVWKRVVRGAVRVWANFFSTLGGIPSGTSLPFTVSMITGARE